MEKADSTHPKHDTVQETESASRHLRKQGLQLFELMNSSKNDASNLEQLRTFISSGGDINVTDMRRSTLLHVAAKNCDLKITEILLNSDSVRVNEVDAKGRIALHCFVEYNGASKLEDVKHGIELFVKHGSDVNAQDKNSETPLHLIFQKFTLEIPDLVSFFLSIAPQYDVTLKNADGHTIFHIFMSDIVAYENKHELAEIMSKKETFINDFIKGGILDLSRECITALLNDKKTTGYSAFHTYVDSAHYSPKTVQALIEAGADVNTTSNIGVTPLISAVYRSRIDIIEILLGSGANVNAEDIFGRNALFHVTKKSAFDLLLAAGISVNIQDKFGVSPLTHVRIYSPENLPYGGISVANAFSEVAPLAEYFTANQADISIVDKHGGTLLHYGAWFAESDMVNFLLERGLDPKIKDNHGMTPRDLALYHGNYHVMKLLSADENELEDGGAKVKLFMKLLDYTRMIVYYTDVKNLDHVLKKLGIHMNPSVLVDSLMSSPFLGLVDRRSETLRIKDAVICLMQSIAKLVSETDDRFRCSVFPTGSSAEGTQVGDPSEFDFVFCLENFAENCGILQPEELLNTGFAFLQLKDYDNNHALVPYVDDEGIICAEQVRGKFQDLVIAAVNNKAQWESGNLYFDGYVSLPNDKPILNVRVTWLGAIIKLQEVSIDIVPAIHKRGWFPKELDPDSLDPLSDGVLEPSWFLLLHTPEMHLKNSENYVRISSAPMEIKYMQNLPDIFRESYGVSKILKGANFCPAVAFNDDIESDLDVSDNVIGNFDIKLDKLFRSNEINESVNQQGASQEEKDRPSITCSLTEVTKDDVVSKKPGVRTFDMAEPGFIEPVFGWMAAIDENRAFKKLLVLDSKTSVKSDENVIEGKPASGEDNGKGCLIVEDENELQAENESLDSGNKIDSCHPTVSRENISDEGHDDPVPKPKKKRRTGSGKTEGTFVSPNSPDNSKFSNRIAHINEASGLELSSAAALKEEGAFENENVGTDQFEKNDAVDRANSGEIQTPEKEGTEFSSEVMQTSSMALDCPAPSTEENSEDSTSENTDEELSSASFESETRDSLYELGENIVLAREEISSYMLKNCLFYVIREMQAVSNVEASDVTHLHVVKRMYEHLRMRARDRKLNAYCMPFVDIFSYVTTHIRMIPEEKADAAIAQQCGRIEAFCDLILEILNQTE